MDFFAKTGKMALGSRLRLLTAKVTEDASRVYALYEVDFVPKWFPVFFALSEGGVATITEIAEQIGHSQPSVTKIVKEMIGAGLVRGNLKSADKRRNVVGLTEKGEAIAKEMMAVQSGDVERAIDGIIAEATHNLWEAIAEWEFLLEQKSLFKRVQEQMKMRESKDVRIVAYEPKYKAAFRSLNEEWISEYFEMEESDYRLLDDPETSILGKGGAILVALYHGEPVGVCALVRMENDPEYDFELAKMAVSSRARGKSIGWMLGQAMLSTAEEMGASKIYLEGNTILKASIPLYQKLGFTKVAGRPSPYKRVNIQMELDLASRGE